MLPEYALVSSPLSVKSSAVASTAGECQEEGSEKNSWQEELGAGGACCLRGEGQAPGVVSVQEQRQRGLRWPTDDAVNPLTGELAGKDGLFWNLLLYVVQGKTDDKDPNSGEISFHTRKVAWPGIAMNSKIRIKSNESSQNLLSKRPAPSLQTSVRLTHKAATVYSYLVLLRVTCVFLKKNKRVLFFLHLFVFIILSTSIMVAEDLAG